MLSDPRSPRVPPPQGSSPKGTTPWPYVPPSRHHGNSSRPKTLQGTFPHTRAGESRVARIGLRLRDESTRRSPMSAEVQDLAVRYGAAWAAHDLDAIMALHTEDTVFHLHGNAEPAVGLAAAREAFAGAMAQWPDIRFERKRVHVGSAHFVSEYQMAATEAGQQIEIGRASCRDRVGLGVAA